MMLESATRPLGSAAIRTSLTEHPAKMETYALPIPVLPSLTMIAYLECAFSDYQLIALIWMISAMMVYVTRLMAIAMQFPKLSKFQFSSRRLLLLPIFCFILSTAQTTHYHLLARDAFSTTAPRPAMTVIQTQLMTCVSVAYALVFPL